MDGKQYKHKQFNTPEEPLVMEPGNSPGGRKNKNFKREMLKRTVLTALLSSLVTLIAAFAVFISLAVTFLSLETSIPRSAIVFSDEKETIEEISKLDTILDRIRDNYYEELSDSDIIEAIYKGFPSALGDPYTYYLDEETYQRTREAMEGDYVGIGCTVTRTPQGYTQIVEVYPDSPAEEAGLKPEDIFVTVDGIDVKITNDTAEIAALVRGEEGTFVTIEIIRHPSPEPIEFVVERRLIQSRNVRYEMLDEKTGYVHVRAFALDVDRDFIAAMDELKDAGAKNVILDLRYNSGGGANIMIEMLEYLLPPDKVLATIKGRDRGEYFQVEWKTEKEMQVHEDMMFAVLTNVHSASASEFFAGCLRDHGKAIIIGEKTFGKGTGTNTYVLDDGSAISIAVFQYFLPDGDPVEGEGITPDIEIRLPEEHRNKSIEAIPVEEDTVIQKAIEALYDFS